MPLRQRQITQSESFCNNTMTDKYFYKIKIDNIIKTEYEAHRN